MKNRTKIRPIVALLTLLLGSGTLLLQLGADPAPGSVVVTVTTAAGSPAAKVPVSLRQPLTGPSAVDGDRPIGRAALPDELQARRGVPGRGERTVKQGMTDESGRVTFSGVKPGRYTVHAGNAAVGIGKQPADVQAGQSVSVQVTLAAPQR